MLREYAKGLEVGGGPDYEAFVGAAGCYEPAIGGGRDGEDWGGMVLVFGVTGFVAVAAGVDEFSGTTTHRWWRLLRARLALLFLGWWWEFGRRGELPFYQYYVFRDCIDVGRTDSNGGRGLSISTERGLGGGGEIERGGYVAVKSSFRCGL